MISLALVTIMALTVVSGAGVLKAQAAVSLGDALDNSALTWTTGGDAAWFGETTTAHDSVDAAQSGAIGDDQSSWLSTTVTGPGTVTFWWKVSSEMSWDFLRFYINDIEQCRMSGSQVWVKVVIPVAAAGQVTLKWAYTKDAATKEGYDAGWVDQVKWTSGKVSAPKEDTVRRYDLTGMTRNDNRETVEVTYGTLTVDVRTGHYVLNVNPAKMSDELKERYKVWFRENPTEIRVRLANFDTRTEVGLRTTLGTTLATINNGANIHGEGTITDAATLQTIATWPAYANVGVSIMLIPPPPRV